MRKSISLLMFVITIATEINAQIAIADSLFNDTLYWNRFFDDVTVVTHRPAVKFTTDKVEYRASEDPDSKTQTVLEMLRKVPMVSVDGKNNISINGSKEFQVYIDGRPSQMITRNPSKILRSMPAGTVQRIEVITNPGAKYDAEGIGGILNIITKKKNTKKQAEISGTTHSTIGTSRWGEDVTLSILNNKWTTDISLMGEYEYQAHAPMGSVVKHLEESPYTETSDQDSREKMPSLMGNMEIGYQIDSISQIRMSLAGNYMKMSDKGTTTYRYIGGAYGNGLELMSDNETSFDMMSADGSLDYQRFFGRDNEGSMVVSYQYNISPGKTKISQTYLDDKRAQEMGMPDISMMNKEKAYNHNGLLSVVIPAAQWLKINTGAKLTIDINKSEIFRQQQQIMATYGETEMSLGKVEARVGLRHEYTWQKSEYDDSPEKNFNLNYGLLSPSASVTIGLDEQCSIGMNYNLRIRRPGIEELNPFVTQYDPFTLSYGNPHLDVEKTHSFSALFMLHLSRMSLNTTLSHSMKKNGIEQYSTKKDGLINTTYGNIAESKHTMLNISMGWSMTASTRVMLNGGTTYSDYRSKEMDAKNHGWSANCNLGLQQKLPCEVKWSTNMSLMTKSQSLQGWQSGMAMLTTSIAKDFCNDKLNIAVSADTGLGHGGDIVWKSHSATKEFVNDNTFTMPAQNISIGLTYMFGKSMEKREVPDGGMDMPMPQMKTRRR